MSQIHFIDREVYHDQKNHLFVQGILVVAKWLSVLEKQF